MTDADHDAVRFLADAEDVAAARGAVAALLHAVGDTGRAWCAQRLQALDARAAELAGDCRHGYRLTDSCPCCDAEEHAA